MNWDGFESWAAEIARLNDTHTFCEDCGIKTEHGGMKCRACYAQWKRILYQDIPREQANVCEMARELGKANQDVRKAIALAFWGEPSGMVLSAMNADLLHRFKRAAEGPFKQNIENMMSAIKSSVAGKDVKPRGRLED